MHLCILPKFEPTKCYAVCEVVIIIKDALLYFEQTPHSVYACFHKYISDAYVYTTIRTHTNPFWLFPHVLLWFDRMTVNDTYIRHRARAPSCI